MKNELKNYVLVGIIVLVVALGMGCGTSTYTIEGYDELVDMYGDLIYYIEKHRDLLLQGCNGLTNAQQEIKKEYETLLQFNQKSFEHLEKLLTERQKLISKKEE